MPRGKKAPVFPGIDTDEMIVMKDEKHIEYRFLSPEERDYLCWMLDIPIPETVLSGIIEMEYCRYENIFNDFDSDKSLPIIAFNGNYRFR